jgi:glycerophosphoryl diester phosphodiesterase
VWKHGRVLDDVVPTPSGQTLRSGPLVIAHRGSSLAEPEHTLRAYVRAIEEGADALECDVRLTADSHLVCVHDRRVNRTSNGRGIVSTLELAELEGLDWGSWKQQHPGDLELPDRDRNRLLTLRSLLTTLLESERPVGLLIEIKHPTRYGGLTEARLVELLTEFGRARRVLQPNGRPAIRVMSFAEVSMRRMQRLAPDLDLVYLMGRQPRRCRDGSLPSGVSWTGISKDILRTDPGYVARAQAKGHQVNVWTVNEPTDVARCLDAGVDTITTDRPRAVRAQVFAAR